MSDETRLETAQEIHAAIAQRLDALAAPPEMLKFLRAAADKALGDYEYGARRATEYGGGLKMDEGMAALRDIAAALGGEGGEVER